MNTPRTDLPLDFTDAERQRFKDKTETRGDCIEMTGYRMPYGYALFYYRGRQRLAHRVAFAMHHGRWPELELDHTCDNEACVRVGHLIESEHGPNVLRGTGPPALNARKTHCVNGHALAGDNLYITKIGKRHCRACDRERKRRAHGRALV